MKPLTDYFENITDPRVNRTRLHHLVDILAICLCATVAGVTGWDSIEEFGKQKEDWLKRFLSLKNGIPSADTLRRVMERIDPVEFQANFSLWVRDILPKASGVIAIDGKTIKSKRNPIHLVSAWSNANEGLCLGQVATEAKSNEITAVPNLLDFLDIRGCIVTLDAMGCQKKIAQQIVEEKEAEFCLAVKGNQPSLYNQLQEYFAACDGSAVNGARRSLTCEKNRGRMETRIAYVSYDSAAIPALECWPFVKSFGMIISQRTENARTSIERRFYISSLKLSAKKLNDIARSHWSIENSLHWTLDVTFKEDGNRTVKDHSQQNMATLRKFAVNLLNDSKEKLSKPKKMLRALLNESYLATLLKLQ